MRTGPTRGLPWCRAGPSDAHAQHYTRQNRRARVASDWRDSLRNGLGGGVRGRFLVHHLDEAPGRGGQESAAPGDHAIGALGKVFLKRHRDHRIVGQVVLDAAYPFARDHLAYPDLLAEGLEPHKVKEMLFWDAGEINYRSDITATFGLKIKALHCHKSQIAELTIDDPERWLRERCHAAAAGEDFELAEAFFRLTIDR